MNEKIKSTAAFESEYLKLNSEQKKAVDCIEGPLLVIAGPGTGKTQILAIRIGHILLNTDADAKNILCLTYTESGAANMRKRLIQFIGPTAYEVSISTFHAFCNHVIRENPESFFHFSDYEVVSELEKRTIYQKIFSSLDRENALYSYTENYEYEIPRLNSLFEKIKKENWDPDTILEDIDHWVKAQRESEIYIYKNKGKNNLPGDFKEAQFKKEVLVKASRSKAAVAFYKIFQEELDKIHRYEYEDMIQWVIRQFESDDALLQKYQEKYQYILVDEYQDTNGAQNKILFQLLNYHDFPNVFAVGDDDQAIYRFQGANVQNMFDFDHLYRPEKIRLVSNYRSSQIILDTANSLISNNDERLVTKENVSPINLIASGDYAGTSVRPILTKYPDQKTEVLHICQQIKTLLDNGVAPDKIAILYRKNQEADPFIKWFSVNNIPHQISKQVNLLDDFFLQQLLLLLKYFAAQDADPYQQDHLLYRLMHAPFIELDASDIGKIAFKHKDLRYAGYDDMEEKKERNSAADNSLLKLLSNEILLAEINVQNTAACQKLYHLLTQFQKQLDDHTPQVFLEKLVNEFQILKFILQLEDKFHYLQILNSLFEFIKSESDKNPRLGILDFVNILEAYQNNNLVIPFKSFSGSVKGLILSTLHSAKGQEYDYVFMINGTQSNWNNRNTSSFKLPESYVNTNVSNDEDLRRLFYVGITRAKFGLYLSYATAGDKSEMVPCRFIEEIKSSGLLDEREHLAKEQDVLEQMVIEMSPLKKEFIMLEQNHFEKFIETFRLSPTALNKYLECPVAFYYEKVLRIPGARTPSLGFGNAVHYALELFMKGKCLKFPKPGEKLLNYFKRGMLKFHSHFTQREYENYLSEGERVLVPFLNHFQGEWLEAEDDKVELKINTEFSEVPISGKLDRIDIMKQGVRVVDYKTGKPDLSKIKAPSDKLKYGSNYWQQMVFYAVLLKHYGPFKNANVTSSFYFVNPSKDDKFEKSEMEPGEFVPFLEELIVDCYSKIKEKQFTPGCGKETCEWCRYIDSGANVSLVEEAVEMSDNDI
ncbi:MAG: ATP-dependent helicase [Saprospiraceae bacterium]|nr:ATP-dependent helicase [Saprospiraceae bacterium]